MHEFSAIAWVHRNFVIGRQENRVALCQKNRRRTKLTRLSPFAQDRARVQQGPIKLSQKVEPLYSRLGGEYRAFKTSAVEVFSGMDIAAVIERASAS